MKFIIDRSKWLRGEGSLASKLLRSTDGKQCCVGQMCSQLGLADRQISDKYSILALADEDAIPLKGILCDDELLDYEWVQAAYIINDNQNYDDEAREYQLTELLKKYGHELEFKG